MSLWRTNSVPLEDQQCPTATPNSDTTPPTSPWRTTMTPNNDPLEDRSDSDGPLEDQQCPLGGPQRGDSDSPHGSQRRFISQRSQRPPVATIRITPQWRQWKSQRPPVANVRITAPNIDNVTAPPSGHNENYTPIPNDTAPPGGDSENYTPQW